MKNTVLLNEAIAPNLNELFAECFILTVAKIVGTLPANVHP